jgi:RNA polymerase sigma factor (sigma-70 family)
MPGARTKKTALRDARARNVLVEEGVIPVTLDDGTVIGRPSGLIKRGEQYGLVVKMARDMFVADNAARRCQAHRAGGIEDLLQEGVIGLLRAAELYDPSCGFTFPTYAYRGIRHAMLKAANTGGVVRLPTSPRGPRPTIIQGRHEGWDGADRHDDIDACDHADELALLPALLSSLAERDADALRLRYLEGLTFSEVGQRLGIGRKAADQAVKRALAKVRRLAGVRTKENRETP